jgi:hypothetical protein
MLVNVCVMWYLLLNIMSRDYVKKLKCKNLSLLISLSTLSYVFLSLAP